MKKILVIAPHPDDETLGCGGTLLKHRKEGDEIHWLIVTKLTKKIASQKRIQQRKIEVEKVSKFYGFSSVVQLQQPAAELDQVSDMDLIQKLKSAILKISPEVVYLPYQFDAHSDHKKTYDCSMACLKVFRALCVKKILVYEVLSETNFCKEQGVFFSPNTYIDITPYIRKKTEAMRLYAGELKEHPFPRSERAIEALGILRGSEMGVEYAEAFHMIKSIGL